MSTQAYCPDPDDSGITFNLRTEVEDVANVVTAMESDSDEAPEEVPFTQSKETALSVLLAEKKGKQDVHDSKARKRQKTIALHIKEKEEKLKRLEVLASKKLPDNLLESISSAALDSEENDLKRKRGKHITFKRTHKKFDSEHYIPLDTESTSSSFKMAVLETKKWKDLSKPGSNPVRNFRHQALNNANIRRISVGEMHNSLAKQATADKFKLVGG